MSVFFSQSNPRIALLSVVGSLRLRTGQAVGTLKFSLIVAEIIRN